MQKKRGIILHIGAPKTGTTALQDYLVSGRDCLQSAGLLVPATGLVPGSGHQELRVMLNRKARTQDERIDFFEALSTEVESCDPYWCVMSTESLWTVEALGDLEGWLGKIFEQVKVIFYWRDQSSLIPSHYAQKVKTGALASSIPDFISKNARDYDFERKMTVWENFFGQGAVVALSWQEAGVKGGIVPHFLLCVAQLLSDSDHPVQHQTFTSEAEAARKSKRISNRFVGSLLVNMLLTINQSSLGNKEKTTARQMLLKNRQFFSDGSGAEGLLDDEASKLVEVLFSASNVEFFKRAWWLDHPVTEKLIRSR